MERVAPHRDMETMRRERGSHFYALTALILITGLIFNFFHTFGRHTNAFKKPDFQVISSFSL